MARDVFVLGGKRTPMGEYVGALNDTSAIDLGAIAARLRWDIRWARLEHVWS